MSVSDIAVGLLGDHSQTAEDRLEVTEEHADGDRATQIVTQSAVTTTRDTGTGTDADFITTASRYPSNTANDFRRRSRRHVRFLFLLDIIIGAVTLFLGAVIAPNFHHGGIVVWIFMGLTGAIAWPFWLASTKCYQRRRIGVAGEEFPPVMHAAALVIILSALPTAWFGLRGLLSTISIAVPVAAVASVSVRIVARRHLRRRQRSGDGLRRAIIVGSPESVDTVWSAVDREHRVGLQVAGVCVPSTDTDRAHEMGLPIVADTDHVAAAAGRLDCHSVVATGTDATQPNFLRQLAWSLESSNAELLVHPGLGDIARTRMHIHAYPNISLLHIDQPHFSGWSKVLKRLTDVSITSLGILLISPLLLIIAIAIKVDDRHGPVIFRQQRIGIDGQAFTMYKFRTMVTDAETRLSALQDRNQGAGPMFKMHHDPRVTRIGQFLRHYSLDELPQLFNVLTGSMSLVGPRPALQSEVNTYVEHARRRLKVTPGITGLWQINGRSTLTWQESIRLDLRYVENWSVILDLSILLQTAQAVVAKEGAF